jgi:hypothetical protein
MNTIYSIALSVLAATGSLYADSNTPAKDTIWSRSWSEGGGASDSCYYFLGRVGAITRVRVLYVAAYDDGASGTDYFLEGGTLRVDKIKGEKKLAEEQVKGRDSGIRVVSTYTLQTFGAQEALISSTGDENLTKQQRQDISELISLLHELIDAKKQEAEQVVPPNGP